MNRRTLIKTTGVAALGLLMKPNLNFAADTVKELKLVNVIGTNHGHELNAPVTLADVVLLLQQIHVSGQSAPLNIQGSSRHSHTVELNEDMLLQLLLEGKADLVSSTDFGHNHTVSLQLVEQ